MNYLKIGLLILIPYILYLIIINWLENEYGLELSKMIKSMIFIIIDILIFMIFN